MTPESYKEEIARCERMWETILEDKYPELLIQPGRDYLYQEYGIEVRNGKRDGSVEAACKRAASRVNRHALTEYYYRYWTNLEHYD